MPPRKRKFVKPKDKDEMKVKEIINKDEKVETPKDPVVKDPAQNQKEVPVQDQPEKKVAPNPMRISIAGLKLQPISICNLKIFPKGTFNITPNKSSLEVKSVASQAKSGEGKPPLSDIAAVKTVPEMKLTPVKSTTQVKQATPLAAPTSPHKAPINISSAKMIPLGASGIKIEQLKVTPAKPLGILQKSTDVSKFTVVKAVIMTPKIEDIKVEKSNKTVNITTKRPLEEKSEESSPKRSSRRIMKIEETQGKSVVNVKPQIVSSPRPSRNQATPKVAPGSSKKIQNIKSEVSKAPPVNSPTETRRSGLRGIKLNINILLGKKEPQSPSKKLKQKPKNLLKFLKPEPEPDPVVTFDDPLAPETSFACKKCPLAFYARKDFMNHRKIHKKSNFVCGKCHQTFRFQSSFVNHTCEFWCQVCGKTISNKANLKIHMSYVHGIGDAKYFECDQCGRIYKSKRNIDTHMKNHMESTPFNCAICSKGFSHLGALKIHMWNHRDTIDCSYCGKKFKPRSLYYHVKKCGYAIAINGGVPMPNVRRVSMKEEHLDENFMDESDYALSNYHIEIVKDDEDE